LQANEQNIKIRYKTNINTATVLNAAWSTKGGDTALTRDQKYKYKYIYAQITPE